MDISQNVENDYTYTVKRIEKLSKKHDKLMDQSSKAYERGGYGHGLEDLGIPLIFAGALGVAMGTFSFSQMQLDPTFLNKMLTYVSSLVAAGSYAKIVDLIVSPIVSNVKYNAAERLKYEIRDLQEKREILESQALEEESHKTL